MIYSCGYDRFMQSGEFLKKGMKHDISLTVTGNLHPCSALDEKKLMMAYKILERQPEMSEAFSSDAVLSYLLHNPQKMHEFDLSSLKTNLGDYERDLAITPKNQPLNMVFWDKGINILAPEEFMLACDKQQRDETLNKDFNIKNDEDFKFAFFNLAYAFANGNGEDKKAAEKLLISLANNNREYLNCLRNLANNNRGHTEVIHNAAAMLCLSGFDELKSYFSSTPYSDRGIADVYLKKLSEKGIIKARAEAYKEKEIDFLCPVNQYFTTDSHKTKTNLLDYSLQIDDAEKIAQLLNRNADVNMNVERYSKKQEKNLPIKPFERYVDNKIFLKKTRKMRETMLRVAEKLNNDKEAVIDKLFQTLSYKTRENSDVKSCSRICTQHSAPHTKKNRRKKRKSVPLLNSRCRQIMRKYVLRTSFS